MESTSSNELSNKLSTGKSYKDFNDFLQKHTVQKGSDSSMPITNTRIGDKTLNIYGCSYHISDEEYPLFLNLYHNDIIKTKKKEYLTEKQRNNDGPILIDVDLRYDYEVDERQYSKEHVEDLIDLYLEIIKNTYQCNEHTKFPIYVFQKPSVNRIADKKITKDGIHLIIGIQSDHITQRIIRKKVIEKIHEPWGDIPIKNTWEDVFDEGISIGFTNWQLYGSRKPNHDKYQITGVYEIEYDTTDDEFMRSEISISNFDISKNIQKLSARYKEHISLFLKNSFLKEYEDFKRKNKLGDENSCSNTSNSGVSSILSNQNMQNIELMNQDIQTISKINNAEELQFLLNNFLDNLTVADYELKDSYNYVMILPPSYYEEGSFAKWIRVCWVLRNTSPRLLIVWIAFSARSKNFKYSTDILDCCERWRNTDLRKHDGLTKRSLINWVKTDAKEEFEKVMKNTIDYYIEQTLNSPSGKTEDRIGCGDWDLANVLYHMMKDRYVCVSVKGNIWYEYKHHRWQEIDSGTSLRKSISVDMRNLYTTKSSEMNNIMVNEKAILINTINETTQPAQSETKREDKIKSRLMAILNISQRLSRTNDKKNIMTEAKELFYDGSFMGKMDVNPYLICFKNGVFDFKEKIFRNGHPEDNISMCTNIDYIPLNMDIHKNIVDEINTFMEQIFPIPELCRYMWEHLASCLIGTSPNQTFNYYIGDGQNGKSVLINLMEKVLGDYKGDVPLSLITEKRGKVGGVTPEIVQLKGIRYAVMAEPRKGDIINEGIMKQLTSGKDPIQGRAPFMIQTISFIPQFKLVVASNNFMDVKSNDHGTWRRIRAVPYVSLFTDNPIEGDTEKPYQFKIDKYIDEKFDLWKEVFASMLVKIVCETGGLVRDCNIVLEKSNEYRKSQDYISEFVQDRIIREKDGRVKKTEINNEFAIWYMSNYGGKSPSPKDLHEYIEKTFGKPKNSTWYGIKINYQLDANDLDDMTTIEDDEVEDIRL
jgi:P4 family phage/plasmid primase-like protien